MESLVLKSSCPWGPSKFKPRPRAKQGTKRTVKTLQKRLKHSSPVQPSTKWDSVHPRRCALATPGHPLKGGLASPDGIHGPQSVARPTGNHDSSARPTSQSSPPADHTQSRTESPSTDTSSEATQHTSRQPAHQQSAHQQASTPASQLASQPESPITPNKQLVTNDLTPPSHLLSSRPPPVYSFPYC